MAKYRRLLALVLSGFARGYAKVTSGSGQTSE